jgi:transposase-like protein
MTACRQSAPTVTATINISVSSDRSVGQVIDVLVSEKRDLPATRRFFTHALEHGLSPTEVNIDRASTYPRVLDELLPAAYHVTEQYTSNPIETDHGQLKIPTAPMRGLKCAQREQSALGMLSSKTSTKATTSSV